MKIVINSCHGGFSLSTAGTKRFQQLGGELAAYDAQARMSKRNNPLLVQVVEELDEARKLVLKGKDPEEILYDDFGLKPDYVWDLL
jgi:hypothetical protein